LYSSHRTEEAVFGRRTSRYTCECAGSKPGASTADCPSGQWERTVNPSAYAYVGSNPTSATPSQPRFSLRESGLTFLCLFRGRVRVGDAGVGCGSGVSGVLLGMASGECGVKLVPAKPSPAAPIGATMGSGTIFAPMTSGFGAGARSCVIFRRLQESGNALLSHAPLAQSVERFHGKEKVNGSIPLGGSLDCGAVLSARHSTPRRCSSVGRANDS
jgi:hypothetical protein